MKKKNKEGKPNLVLVLPSRSNDWNVKLCFSLKEKLSVAAKRKKKSNQKTLWKDSENERSNESYFLDSSLKPSK